MWTLTNPDDSSEDVDELPLKPPPDDSRPERREGEKSQAILRAVAEGNDMYRGGNFENAVEMFSHALRVRPQEPSFSHIILSNRCVSFCSLSQKLRKIPAAQSERQALFGLDPLSLLSLALKDAEKLLQLQPEWAKAHFRKAQTLFLLEKYDEAHEAYLNGLHGHPSNVLLQKGLKEVLLVKEEMEKLFKKKQTDEVDEDEEEEEEEKKEREEGEGKVGEDGGKIAGEEQRRRRTRKRICLERSDEFDCSLCLKLLFSPITTPCGHSFCKACLVRVLDHGNKCPVCRGILFINPSSYPVTVTLQNILEKSFPEEYRERRAEVEAERLLSKEILPLFVMDVVLPSQKMTLNIFEPRYRLMVRRIMEGDHRMGMVGWDPLTHSIADVACEVQICECEVLPDGRFYLEVEGRRRCRIVKSWEQDGYRVGQVEWMEDEVVEEGSEEAEKMGKVASEVVETAKAWMARVMESARGRRNALTEMVRNAGDMPPTSDLEKLSFWLANLLPVDYNERLSLLRLSKTSERLQRQLNILRDSNGTSCVVQ